MRTDADVHPVVRSGLCSVLVSAWWNSSLERATAKTPGDKAVTKSRRRSIYESAKLNLTRDRRCLQLDDHGWVRQSRRSTWMGMGYRRGNCRGPYSGQHLSPSPSLLRLLLSPLRVLPASVPPVLFWVLLSAPLALPSLSWPWSFPSSWPLPSPLVMARSGQIVFTEAWRRTTSIEAGRPRPRPALHWLGGCDDVSHVE